MSISITSSKQAAKLVDDGKIRAGSILSSVNGMFQVVSIDNLMTDLKEIVYDEESDTEQLIGDYHWTYYDFVGTELIGSGEEFLE